MAGTVPSWQTQPTVWDRVQLGADWLPGRCRVMIEDISSGLDVRKAPKSNRAALVDQGYNPVKASIELTIGFNPLSADWPSASEQFVRWQAILGKIRPRRAGKRVALAVSHPQFELAGVGKVFVTAVSGLVGDGPGVRTVTIRVIEQAPIVAASAGTVTAAKPKGSTSLSTLQRAPNPAATDAGP